MAYRSFWLTGEQIRAARALARLEQRDLARLTGVSLETIKRLERVRGPVDATVRTLGAIARAFDEVAIAFDRYPDGSVGIRQKALAAVAPTPPIVEAEARASHDEGPVHRLIFHSTARGAGRREMRETLDSIAQHATRRNSALGVTGALLACQGRFLQLMEGDRDAVRHLYGAVALDQRHHGLTVVEERSVPSRHFQDWTLCCGLFPDDDGLGDEPSFADGFKPEILTPAAALGLLLTTRNLQRVAPRRHRGAPRDCGVQFECEDRACAQ